MKQNRKRMVASTALLCFLCAGLALGASDGKKVKVNGLITGRDGENVMLRSTKDSSNIVVVLTDDTKVQQPKGLLKLRHAEQSVTALIPGLKIEVEGTGTDARVVAKSISFDKDDLRLAETIQAGLSPTQEQQATNTANIADNKAGVEANKAGVAANQQQGAANAAALLLISRTFRPLPNVSPNCLSTTPRPRRRSTSRVEARRFQKAIKLLWPCWLRARSALPAT